MSDHKVHTSMQEGGCSAPQNLDKLSFDGNNLGSSKSETFNLVHQSKTTRIFRSNGHGIKVRIEPSEDKAKNRSLLNNEYRVSNTFLPLPSGRKIIRADAYEDQPALYFEWVDGVTVGDWLRRGAPNFPQSRGTDAAELSLNARLQVAIAITKALAEFHESGIIHNQLKLDNIIVDFNGGRNCTAILIDYSCSDILSDCTYTIHDEKKRLEYMKTAKQKDLNDLGVVLYSVLGGHSPEKRESDVIDSTDADIDSQKSKKGKSQQLQPVIDLPLYLISLVSSLLTPVAKYEDNDKLQYKNARNVLVDLKLAADKPEIYLKVHRWADLVTSPLVLPKDSFYGRSVELSMLKQSFEAMMDRSNSQPCVVVVSGYAGSGKTTLLKQVNKPLKESNGSMIVCKFDQTAPPDTIFASAFDSFFGHVIECNDTSTIEGMAKCIKETLGEHIAALGESIPNLCTLLGHKETDIIGYIPGDSQATGWKFLLSSLIVAISSCNPISLVFEDLQWADMKTLESIQIIVLDHRIRHCLYCLSYRDTDVEQCQKIINIINGLHDQGVQLWSLKLGPAEQESVNCLVSETLCMPPTIIEPLSCIIHNKTGGLMLFVADFLKCLHEERFIYFNLTTLRWQYDLNKIQHKKVSRDVVDHLSERMLRLPRSFQAVLRIAACLGSSFDLDVFQKANKSPENTNDIISVLVANGFIQELSPNRFTWSHAQLQQAAYSLIPVKERECTHLLVGSRIYLSTNSHEIYIMIFDIVRNMNRGIALLETQEHKTELAHLNMIAGEKSKRSSAFVTASNYFMTGISLLDDGWHNESYKLGMNLYNAATEMLITTGNLTAFESTIKKPLRLAVNFEDRLPALLNYVRFLSISGRHDEALDKCFSILSEFGEGFPSVVTPEIIQKELIKTEALLANFSKDDIINMPRLSDSMKLWLFRTMSSTLLILFATKTQYADVNLVGCRLAQRSAAYGWCCYSAFGLYAFGHALITVLKKVDDGCSWVKTGLALLKELKDTAHLSVIETMYHGFISFWKEPIQATCQALHGTHQAALMEGKIEFAMSSLLHSSRQSFMCGDHLVKVLADCTSGVHKMVQLKQIWSILFHVSQHCLVLKLMDKIDISQAFHVLNGDICNENELIERAKSIGNHSVIHYIYFDRLFHAFWFKRYEEAAEFANLIESPNVMRFIDIYRVFYEGLNSICLARNEVGNKDKWTEIGEKSVLAFQTWEGHSKWNFENKRLLLCAEMEFAKGNNGLAEEDYKLSIRSANKHRFVHEEGLAMELLGNFYSKVGRIDESKEMLKNARDCYEKWGATALVNRLDNELSLF